MAGEENQVAQVAQEVEVAPVPNAEAAPNAEAQNLPDQNQQGYFSLVKGFMFRALIMYAITSYFRRPAATPAGDEGPNDIKAINKFTAQNIFPDLTELDLYVYLSESDSFMFTGSEKPVWFQQDLVYGDWTSGPTQDAIHSKSLTFPASEKVQNNGSIYMHTFIVRSGFSPNPKSSIGIHEAAKTIHTSVMLNKYKKRRYLKTSNLITGHTERSEEEIKKAETMKEEIVSYWHPNMTINIVHDFTPWTEGSVPAPINEFIEFVIPGDRYKPIVFMNTYWNLNKDHTPLNSSVKTLNMTLQFQPLTLFKWQMYAAQAMKNKWPGAEMLSQTEGDQDQDTMKEMFLETSPYLLGLTAIVSLLHSVFEMLAFKNDVQFWNNRKSLEGLSVRSVFFNVFQSLIVLLYVLDNETNFVIKMSCFVGLGIEIWKITKVTDVSLNREKRIMGIPTIQFQDKSSYVHSETRKFDEMAFRYLGMAFFPLMGCYFVYSLVYHEHTGWYSFALSMMYGFLLTFGFIMMTPQLFINYKMKSVAHLPWRMLTYKALNTFIDDIFAFVIKMPTLYRIGCLRDDVIFFIFLYQRYMYPMDPTRMNEFGFSQEMSENVDKKPNCEAIEPKVEGDKEQDKSSTDKKNE